VYVNVFEESGSVVINVQTAVQAHKFSFIELGLTDTLVGVSFTSLIITLNCFSTINQKLSILLTKTEYVFFVS
jgi:hypothetical protein